MAESKKGFFVKMTGSASGIAADTVKVPKRQKEWWFVQNRC